TGAAATRAGCDASGPLQFGTLTWKLEVNKRMAPVRQTPKHGEFVWQNGEFVPWEKATVHASAMGSSGGIAVFEGINGYWNADEQSLNVFRLDRHLERLAQSMKILRMRTDFDVPAIKEAVVELCQRNGIRWDSYIRPVA